jgi:acetolactate synthase-1/2/3 large subunit
VFFLSGQVKTADLKSRYGVRAHGSQEADIVEIVQSITKYAVMVTEKKRIRFELEKAWHEMMSSRRGPVWVDIPLDIQGAQIDHEELPGFTPEDTHCTVDISPIIKAINLAKRPIIIAGNGLSVCRDEFRELCKFLQIPVIPTWKAMDMVSNDDPLYAGRAGGMGDRHGNLAMQNSDLLLCLGSRLDFSITGFDRSEWAIDAEKIVVELDPAEIKKLGELPKLTPFIADVKDVVTALIAQKNEIETTDLTEWMKRINLWKDKYPIKAPDKGLTTYSLVLELSTQLPKGAYVAPCSAGTTAEIFFQAFIVENGQVIRSSHGLGSMGFELPNAIGMCIASGSKDVICIAGDGGMQLNIQELAVITGRKLPIKIFVISNRGYASIRNMQNSHFKSRHVGCDNQSGLFLPDLEKLAAAYGIDYIKISSSSNLKECVESVLSNKNAVICEVFVEGDCLVTPRTATQVLPDGSMCSSPLENQFPFLSEGELRDNMLR